MRVLDTAHTPILCLTFASNGHLFAGARDGHIVAWNLHDGTGQFPCVWIDGSHRNAVSSLSVSSDGQMLASGSWDGTLRIFHPQTFTPLQLLDEIRDLHGPIIAVAFAPDGSELVFSGEIRRGASKIFRVRLAYWATSSSWHTFYGQVGVLAFAPALRPYWSNWLVSGGTDNIVRHWNYRIGTCFHRHRHRSWIQSAAFSPDGRYLATVGSRIIHLWPIPPENSSSASYPSLPKLTNHFSIPTRQGTTMALTFSSNGQWLAAAGKEGSVAIWDVDSRALLRRLHAGIGELYTAAFSPDGLMLAVGGQGGVVLWDMDL